MPAGLKRQLTTVPENAKRLVLPRARARALILI
jgi:hypothetical protein